MRIREIVNRGEINRKRLGSKRLSHIDIIYTAISNTLFQEDLYIQVYELDRQMINDLRRVAKMLKVCEDKCEEEYGWLLKGVFRYYFLARGGDEAAFRYIFGSSSRRATFCSRIFYDIVKGADLRNFISLISLPVKADEGFKTINIHQAVRRINANKYYLIVYIYNIMINGMEIKDIIRKCLTDLGCMIIYSGKLEVS